MNPSLVITGDFDASYVETIRPLLEEMAHYEDDVTIDISASQFLDSSGVGAIVYLYKRLRARGYKLHLRGASGQPMRLLQHLGIAALLDNGSRRAA